MRPVSRQSSDERRALLNFVQLGERAKAAEGRRELKEARGLYSRAIEASSVLSRPDAHEVVQKFKEKIKQIDESLAGGSVGRPRERRGEGKGKGPRAALESSPFSELIVPPERLGVSWEDLVGLDVPKKVLHEVVILPFLNPALFSGLRQPAKGVLLFGPPGNGKTMLAKAVASQVSACTFFSVSASTLTSKWHGEDEKLVKGLFEEARRRAPSVVFMDEVDSILSKRSSSEHEATRRMKNELLTQVDGMATGQERVVIIAATNRPWDLDEAVLRRFPKRLYLPLPSPEARLLCLRQHLSSVPSSFSSRELSAVSEHTEAFSFSDLSHLCREASLAPVRKLSAAQIQSMKVENVPPVKLEHMVEALNSIRPSTDPASLKTFEKWNADFGTRAEG